MKKYLVLPLLVFAIYSCKKEVAVNEENKNTIQKKEIVQKAEMPKENKFQDTVSINYRDNKDILELLTKLPDSAMGSWEWKIADRKKMVHYIQKNNFVIDTTRTTQTITKINPHYFGYQVVDGFWSTSLYKIKENHYIVITDDKVGDGNQINYFEYQNGILKSITQKEIFDDLVLKETLLDVQNQNCVEIFEENAITFDYDFSQKDIIKIASSALKKDSNTDCFKGNSLEYKFDKAKKKFALQSLFWAKQY
jgi:hypothetical protein